MTKDEIVASLMRQMEYKRTLAKYDMDVDNAQDAEALLQALILLEERPGIKIHSRWMRGWNDAICKACLTSFPLATDGPDVLRFKRCPECGAYMAAKT